MTAEAEEPGDDDDDETEGGRRSLKPVQSLWLLPSAITFTAFYKHVFEFGHVVVEFCESMTGFARTAWRRGFELVPAAVPITVDNRTLDLLTLWVTSSMVVLVLPRLTGEHSALPRTTISAVQDVLKLPDRAAQLLAAALIVLSGLLIGAPFAASLASLHGSWILSLGGGALSQWLGGSGRWLTLTVMGLAFCAVGYVYFVHNPRLAKLTPTARERREFAAVSIVLWLMSAAFLVLALFVPLEGWRIGFAAFTKEDSMVLSLLGLAGLVAWRSALPFVQLAVLIVAIFCIDAVYRFGLDVWTASRK